MPASGLALLCMKSLQTRSTQATFLWTLGLFAGAAANDEGGIHACCIVHMDELRLFLMSCFFLSSGYISQGGRTRLREEQTAWHRSACHVDVEKHFPSSASEARSIQRRSMPLTCACPAAGSGQPLCSGAVVRSMTEILHDLELCTMNLTSLDLSPTPLSGTLPAKISTFINLKEIDLHGTGVSGPIPKELSALTSLQKLYVLKSQYMWR